MAGNQGEYDDAANWVLHCPTGLCLACVGFVTLAHAAAGAAMPANAPPQLTSRIRQQQANNLRFSASLLSVLQVLGQPLVSACSSWSLLPHICQSSHSKKGSAARVLKWGLGIGPSNITECEQQEWVRIPGLGHCSASFWLHQHPNHISRCVRVFTRTSLKLHPPARRTGTLNHTQKIPIEPPVLPLVTSLASTFQ